MILRLQSTTTTRVSMTSVQERGMLKTATRYFYLPTTQNYIGLQVSNCQIQYCHLWNALSLQVPSEEEYYQQEEFTHKRKPTSTTNKSKPMPPEHSLFIFSPTNFLRQKCHWLCNHSYFGNVVLLCIMVSSAMLAAEDPLNSQSPRNNVRHQSERFPPKKLHLFL